MNTVGTIDRVECTGQCDVRKEKEEERTQQAQWLNDKINEKEKRI